MATHTLPIEGMSCGHCELAVRQALSQVPGVRVKAVRRKKGLATVEAPEGLSRAALAAAVRDAGFLVDDAWCSGG